MKFPIPLHQLLLPYLWLSAFILLINVTWEISVENNYIVSHSTLLTLHLPRHLPLLADCWINIRPFPCENIILKITSKWEKIVWEFSITVMKYSGTFCGKKIMSRLFSPKHLPCFLKIKFKTFIVLILQTNKLGHYFLLIYNKDTFEI